MCGIAGHVNFSNDNEAPSFEVLSGMAQAIHHRGPDECGLYRDDRAGLVITRLSIVDLSGGQQPMSNEDGTVWIAFNGEIFNFVELRKQLQSLGHRFRTASDTEVIIHAFEEWQDECWNKFNGQWAVALWNSKTGILTLCRDRFGVRPLYVHRQGRKLWFSSEVKALFADHRVPRAFDLQGLDQTFTYWCPLAPKTAFANIEEVQPGTVWTYLSDGQKRESSYWRPSFSQNGSSDRNFWGRAKMRDAAEELRHLLEEATRLRMLRADVPVGSYLSGGLDSSVIAWLGRKAKGGDFRTFSVRFEDAEFDETSYQRMMASTLKSTHEEVLVSRGMIAEAFPSVIAHTECPILRTAPAPLFHLSKLVRDSGIKAVLTGEGADEILAGYDIFREAKIRRFWSRAPESKVRPKLFQRLYPYLARAPQHSGELAEQFWNIGLDRPENPGFSHDPRWRATSKLKRFFSHGARTFLEMNPPPSVFELLPPEFLGFDDLSRAQYLEMATIFAGYILSSQGDRMMMAHSVEGRHPFLDVNVVEYCNSLPAGCKLQFLNEKLLLKLLAEGNIPDEILRRPKQPYRAPDAVAFLGADAPDYVEAFFSEEFVHKVDVLDVSLVQGLYRKCRSLVERSGKNVTLSNTDNMAFSGILSTLLLFEKFISPKPASFQASPKFRVVVDHATIPILPRQV